LIIDDVLATGGTLAASIELLEKLDAKIAGICTLIELSTLNGREKLKGYDFFTLLKY
jgi:Adenine/guanine phosphoribosyltransferases and related PRPP-binding proteins